MLRESHSVRLFTLSRGGQTTPLASGHAIRSREALKKRGAAMKNHSIYAGIALAIFLGGYAGGVSAQDAIDAHLIAARNAAGFDFTGTLARLCVAPVAVPATLRDLAPGPAPARDTWFTDPAKVFDNVYFVGSKIP